MDSLLELNNDLRFEHFIDESLDIDMSAVAMLPPLHSEPYFNFVDEILTTGAASRRNVKSVSPALEFSSTTTHDFLVRFSPEAKKKSPFKEEPPLDIPIDTTQIDSTHEYLVRLSPEIKKKSNFKQEPDVDFAPDDVPNDLFSAKKAASIKLEPAEEGTAVLDKPTEEVNKRKKKQTNTKANEEDGSHEFLVPPAKKKAPTKSKSLPIEFMCHNCNERFTSHIELEKHYR